METRKWHHVCCHVWFHIKKKTNMSLIRILMEYFRFAGVKWKPRGHRHLWPILIIYPVYLWAFQRELNASFNTFKEQSRAITITLASPHLIGVPGAADLINWLYIFLQLATPGHKGRYWALRLVCGWRLWLAWTTTSPKLVPNQRNAWVCHYQHS